MEQPTDRSLAPFAALLFRRLALQEHAFTPPPDIERFVSTAARDASRTSHPLLLRLKQDDGALIEDTLFERMPHAKKAAVVRKLFERRRRQLLERASVILAASHHFQRRIPALEISKRVELYANRLFRQGGRKALNSKSADDFAFEAIADTIEYRRKWRRPNRVSLFQHLCGAVRSSYFNALQQERNFGGRTSESHDADSAALDIRDAAPDAEQVLAGRAAWRLFATFVRERDASLSTFVEAAADLLELGAGRFPNDEIAERLKVTRADVENMRKRLRRVVRDFRERYDV